MFDASIEAADDEAECFVSSFDGETPAIIFLYNFFSLSYCTLCFAWALLSSFEISFENAEYSQNHYLWVSSTGTHRVFLVELKRLGEIFYRFGYFAGVHQDLSLNKQGFDVVALIDQHFVQRLQCISIQFQLGVERKFQGFE